jgi:hypothetical protein
MGIKIELKILYEETNDFKVNSTFNILNNNNTIFNLFKYTQINNLIY